MLPDTDRRFLLVIWCALSIQNGDASIARFTRIPALYTLCMEKTALSLIYHFKGRDKKMKISGILAPISLALMIIVLLNAYFETMRPVPAFMGIALGFFGILYAAVLSCQGE